MEKSIQIITVAIPQMSDDTEIIRTLTKALALHGFDYLDMDIEIETDKILYRFQRIRIENEFELL